MNGRGRPFVVYIPPMNAARPIAIALAACTLVASMASPLPILASAMPADEQAAKQPAVSQAALKKLAEPWPSPDEMEARRLGAERRALFAGIDAFPITLTADFKKINKDRRVEGKIPYAATLTVAGEDGREHTIPVTLKTRGHFRLRATSCGFVPLRVEFSGDAVKGTVFEGQKALKLITHCQGEKEYEQYTMREYLTYRAFNLLTPRSFRARLARNTYVQTGSEKPLITRLGMFLEDDDDVARRMDGRIMDIPRAFFKDVDRETLTLAMVFQYMIGNTDFSIFALHNFRLVRTQSRTVYPVPYDFDMSGLVNASYAIPDRTFGIKSVRDRLYRGPCRPLDELEPVLARFRSQKAAIYALYDSMPELERAHRSDARDYLDEFYRVLDRQGSVRGTFVQGQCSTKETM
jgi:hypothetical protein